MTDEPHRTDAGLRLWLVRHGRTLFNEREIAQGWCDSPLLEEGRSQVHRLAAELIHVPWAGVYSSTSERAMDTAEILVGDRLPIVRDRRWKEYNFGAWEARANDEVFAELNRIGAPGDSPSVRLRGLYSGDFPALENGETGADFSARVADAIADIRAAHDVGDVLVVTHGMTIGVAVGQTDPAFEYGRGVDNASLTLIEYAPDDSAMIRAIGAQSPRDIPDRVPDFGRT